MLNEQEGDGSFSSLLNEFVCIDKDIGDVLSNCVHEMLRILYTQLNKFLKKFQFIADIRIYTKGELANETKFVRFTTQIYVASSETEYTIYTKDPVVVIHDKVRRTNERDLILNIPKNLPLCLPVNGNIGSTACLVASKHLEPSFEHSVS